MHRPLDRSVVLHLLEELDRRDAKRRVFGSDGHQYRLRPPLPQAVVEAFERRHGITLPADYRQFLTEIGDGGAGPYYGVFPFGQHDDGDGLCAWEDGHLVGDPSKPFRHEAAWNLPETFWAQRPDPPPGVALEEEDRLMEAWDRLLEEHYWNPSVMDGAIPICHRGCALREWLVVNGGQKGYVWRDDRVDDRGVSPVRDKEGRPMTFSDWYMAWLDGAVRQVG